jgi:hypothetical protein
LLSRHCAHITLRCAARPNRVSQRFPGALEHRAVGGLNDHHVKMEIMMEVAGDTGRLAVPTAWPVSNSRAICIEKVCLWWKRAVDDALHRGFTNTMRN